MKLVLIDRDGVINEELSGYVTSADQLKILETSLEALALLHRQGFTCVVITNQSVVGRGIISPSALDGIHNYMCETVKSRGGHISEVIACTDRPDCATYRRKPKPGMLIEALEKYQAAPEATPFIGDAITDMEAAHAAGCARYLVMTGKGRKTAASLPDALKPVNLCEDLLAASLKIIEAYRG